jgi:3-deoxy-D-manno-octulosonic-acid transferase
VDPLIFFHGIYQGVGGLLAIPAVFTAALSGRHGGQWLDRLGYVVAGGGKPLWLHASSVGEAGSAIKLISSLREILPDQKYVLSLGTPAGLKYATGILEDDPLVQLIAAPLDFWGSPGRALDRMDPKALILMEAEVWPGLIRKCHKRKIPIILASGRVSEKSKKRYELIRPFFRQLFDFMDLITVISQEDELRLKNLGVDPEKIIVMGNPKYDGLIKLAREDAQAEADLGPPLLIVAGSTHPGEEEIIISSVLKLLVNSAVKKSGGTQPASAAPSASPASPSSSPSSPASEAPGGDPPAPVKLIIAPRHVERAVKILDLAERSGFSAKLISDPEIPLEELPEISVVSVLGKLSDFYKKANVAIVGGSFVAGCSGHNPLEPAALGKPVIFGPNMESFSEPAGALMNVGAAKMCLPQDLLNVLVQITENPDRSKAYGRIGQEAVAKRTLVGPVIAKAIKAIVFEGKSSKDIMEEFRTPELSLEKKEEEEAKGEKAPKVEKPKEEAPKAEEPKEEAPKAEEIKGEETPKTEETPGEPGPAPSGETEKKDE